MAAKDGQKGAQKESEFTKNGNFWGSCAQGLILTSFLSNSEANYARNNPKINLKIQEKLGFFQGRLKNEKLRLDCAGASGSRLGPSRKACKNTEKPVCEPTHLQTIFSLQKYLKNFNPWEQKSHRSISFQAQSPQTPLLNKLTLSTRNSNHSRECFPSSRFGPPRVLPAAPMVP